MAKVVRLNEGQLRKLVRRVLRENVVGDEGYKIYLDPRTDAALDDVVEFIDLHRQETGKRWPVLLNGGNPIDAPGEPFDGYYAVGFDDPNEASEFASEVRAIVKDVFTEEEAGARSDIAADMGFEARYGSGYRRKF